MSYPIDLTPYINYDLVTNLCLGLSLVAMLIALWFDLTYKPKVYDLTTLLNHGIHSTIRESFSQAPSPSINFAMMTDEEFQAYLTQSEEREKKDTLVGNPYKAKEGFERPQSPWVHRAFQAVGKQVKSPYRSPIKFLSVEESERLQVGCVELVKVENKVRTNLNSGE